MQMILSLLPQEIIDNYNVTKPTIPQELSKDKSSSDSDGNKSSSNLSESQEDSDRSESGEQSESSSLKLVESSAKESSSEEVEQIPVPKRVSI